MTHGVMRSEFISSYIRNIEPKSATLFQKWMICHKKPAWRRRAGKGTRNGGSGSSP